MLIIKLYKIHVLKTSKHFADDIGKNDKGPSNVGVLLVRQFLLFFSLALPIDSLHLQ